MQHAEHHLGGPPSLTPMSKSQEQSATAAFFFLVLYIVVVFVRPQEFVPAVLGWPIMPALIMASFLSWLTAANAGSLRAPQFYLLGALFLYSTLTVILAGEGMANALQAIARLAPLYLTFLLISVTALSRKRMHIMMWLMVGGAIMLSLHGIQQKMTGIGWTGEVPVLGRIRYIGIFNDPNDVGLSLVTALPMAMYLLRHHQNTFIKLLLLLGIGTILWGIKLTDSRGTVLAVGAILGIFSLRRYGFFKTLMVALIAIPLMFMASSRLDTISPEEESAHERVEAWYEGIQMLKEHPVFGVGFGQFPEHHYLTAHNSYVLVLAEQGLPGYFLWFSFFGICILMMYKLQKTQKEPTPRWQELNRFDGQEKPSDVDHGKKPVEGSIAPEDQAIARALFLSFVGFASASFFLSRSYSMQLFLLCGMAVAHYQGARLRNPEMEEYRFSDHFWFWAFTSGASVIFLYMTIIVLLSLA